MSGAGHHAKSLALDREEPKSIHPSINHRKVGTKGALFRLRLGCHLPADDEGVLMIEAISSLAGVTAKTVQTTVKTEAKRAEDPSVSSPPTGSSTPIERSSEHARTPPEETKSGGPEPKPTTELKQAVESMNSFLQDQKRALEFSVDEETGHVVISVMDVERKEVIRQIPSEQALKLMAQMREGGMRWTGLTEKA
jgi:flagellar protein FlaG